MGLRNIYPSEHFLPISKRFIPDFRTENMVSFKEAWPWNEFKRFVVFSIFRWKGEVDFFIIEFLEVFYFPSAFIVPLLLQF